MIGKKNIVFGFIYLALTAALGAVMILGYFDERGAAESVKREKLGILQQIVADNYEVNLEPVTPLELAKANTEAIFAFSARDTAQSSINNIRSGPHTHGTAEGLLNIAVGFFTDVPGGAGVVQAGDQLDVHRRGALTFRHALSAFRTRSAPAGILLNGPPGAIGRGLILLGWCLPASPPQSDCDRRRSRTECR